MVVTSFTHVLLDVVTSFSVEVVARGRYLERTDRWPSFWRGTFETLNSSPCLAWRETFFKVHSSPQRRTDNWLISLPRSTMDRQLLVLAC